MSTTGTAVLLLDDGCWGLANAPDGFDPEHPMAECEDGCNLDLDHTGLCGPTLARRASQQESCAICGQVGRLHAVDAADVTPEGAEALLAEIERTRP